MKENQREGRISVLIFAFIFLQFVGLFICLFICLFVSLLVRLFACLFVCFPFRSLCICSVCCSVHFIAFLPQGFFHSLSVSSFVYFFVQSVVCLSLLSFAFIFICLFLLFDCSLYIFPIPLFTELAKLPADLTQEMILHIERFVVLLYKRTSPIKDVNTARLHLFSSGNRQIDNIPPTSAALLQHLKRAIFQCHVWYQSLNPSQNLPDPSNWGWVKDDSGWQPVWTTLPEATKVCLELIKCGCQKGCGIRCKCRNINLSCTYLCFCAGQCDTFQ